MNEPIEVTRLTVFQPISAGYVYIRRGMPSNPAICMGKKATLKPTNIIQKPMRPIRSLIIRPVNFGNQK